MHIFGLGLHILVALYFAVHAVRTNQGLYWLLILFMFPLLGSLAYGLAIWLPELRASRGARRATQAVRRVLDPGRELRDAQDAVDLAPSVGNRLRLGDALVAAGRASEAVPHLQAAAQGLYADDPDLQARLAHALLESGRHAEARATLDALIAKHPDYRNPRAHLVYARAVAASGDQAQAREEFDVLVQTFPGLEARARYAMLLAEWGDREGARGIAAAALAEARRLPRHTRDDEKAWIGQLERIAG